MENFDRYGAVEINSNNIVTGFHEKQYYKKGLINGGTYILNKERFNGYALPEKFSFEKDFLEEQVLQDVSGGKLAGQPQDAYFIDIGVPEDYNKAQKDLQLPPLDLKTIDKNWTLFLDRDGVINVDKPGSYIFNTGEFVFMEGQPGIFRQFADRFKYIIVVTNQRGVERALMTEDALKAIHKNMVTGINAAGGKTDAVYYCTAINNDHPDRKPNPGMAARAKADFPAIDFTRSIMVGNNISDMQFGRNAGMHTVFVKTTNPNVQLPHPDIDLLFDSLANFAKAL
jgi:D-glycero-alpha-D-manno-heptose 1-phosphate guanylyltransferase